VKSGTAKRILANLGISTSAALITPVFASLLQAEVNARALVTILVISALYANAITFLADWVCPPIYPRVQKRSAAVQWTVLILALIAVSTVGWAAVTLVFLVINVAAGGFIPWANFRADLPKILGLCIFITLAFGLVIAAYDRLRGRLSAAELKLRTEELERERAIKLATEARLMSLQARVHPHFLFNTLNSISSLIPADPERAERLIERMAALLRFSLDSHCGGLVPLEQELKVVRDYLEIEKARLGRRLLYRVESGDQLADLTVPPLSVQTLVENSIKYAIAPSREGGEIRVQADRKNGYLRVNVTDTGPGFALESAPPGHGLDNLKAQLAALFGNAAELTVTRSGTWTTVSLKVPA